MVDDDDKLEHLSEQELAFMEAGGHGSSFGMMVYNRAPGTDAGPRKHRRTRRTRGGLRKNAIEAWVYVATAEDGAVKVGISSNIPQRMRTIGGELRLMVSVAPEAAPHVETEAFQLLGHDLDAGEWLRVRPEEAMAAVWTAYTATARRMCVIPGVSPDDARKMRIALAKLNGV